MRIKNKTIEVRNVKPGSTVQFEGRLFMRCSHESDDNYVYLVDLSTGVLQEVYICEEVLIIQAVVEVL